MSVQHLKRAGVMAAWAAAWAMGPLQCAHAQSSVTLYGTIDASLLYTSKTLDMKTGGNAGHQYSFNDSGLSGSNFGMRGVEDLGGNLRAIFALESGFSVANGAFANSNGNAFGRQAWVGVDGGFGTVKAGLQYSPFFIALYDFDPRGMSYFGSGLVSYNNNVYVTGLFNANSVSYTSPEIAGLQAMGLFAMGGAAGDFQAGRQYSGSVRYHAAGLTIDAALYSGNAGGSAAAIPVPSVVEFEGRTIGASYRFASLTLNASYVQYKTAGSFNNRVYSGGLSYRFTPAFNVDAGVWYTRDANNSTNHSVLASTGVDYYLSKATLVYGQVGFVNNHGAMASGISVNNAFNGPTGTTIGANLGIRHLF